MPRTLKSDVALAEKRAGIPISSSFALPAQIKMEFETAIQYAALPARHYCRGIELLLSLQATTDDW